MPKAIVAGVAAALMLQVLAVRVSEYMYACCSGPQSSLPVWYATLSSPIGAIVALLPGFIAGWLHPRSGIVAGFLAGLIGNTIYSAVYLTQWPTVIEGGVLEVVEFIFRLLILATSWAFGTAAAGGTAQLLRSNIRLQRAGEE